MSDVTVSCPQCSQALEVPDELLGQTVECPSCKGSFEVPKPEPEPGQKSTQPCPTQHSDSKSETAIPLQRRHWYPAWWWISWRVHCSAGRKIAAAILFILPTFLAAMFLTRASENPLGAVLLLPQAILIALVWGWPFLLVVTPPSPKVNKRTCCAGCGIQDDSLRHIEYTIGFALFGLIPLFGGYSRPLCSLCRNFPYRVAVTMENLFALVFFPVGTVLGVIWLVRNNFKPNLRKVHQPRELPPARMWTSTRDGHQFSAQFVRQDTQYAYVRRKDAELVKMPKAGLAAADRQYVASLQQDERPAEQEPQRDK